MTKAKARARAKARAVAKAAKPNAKGPKHEVKARAGYFDAKSHAVRIIGRGANVRTMAGDEARGSAVALGTQGEPFAAPIIRSRLNNNSAGR